MPDELYVATRIDGGWHFRFLLQVVLPLSRAPLMVITVLTFMGSWNALAWPILVTNTPDWRPISVGLMNFVSDAGQEFQLTMAGAFITIIPVSFSPFISLTPFPAIGNDQVATMTVVAPTFVPTLPARNGLHGYYIRLTAQGIQTPYVHVFQTR